MYLKINTDNIPLIYMTDSDLNTILIAWSKAKVLTTEYNQTFTVFTSDLHVYRVAVNIVLAHPEQIYDVILRLGRIHILMNVIRSIEH